MYRFDESKHKRDELGRFAKKDFAELKSLATQEIENRPQFEEKRISDIIIQEIKHNRVKKVGAKYNLNSREINAIHKYVNSFDDSWYKLINETLRKGLPLSKEDEQICKHLDSALDKIAKYKGDLLRVIDLQGEDLKNFLDLHQVGKTVTYDAYTSTSSSEEPQERGNVYISIPESKCGADLRDFNPAQSEILYKRNAKFKVVDLYKYGDVYKVSLEEV